MKNNKLRNIIIALSLIAAGAVIGTAVVTHASTHTLQFVETPTIQLYQGESYIASSIVVTPVPVDLDGNVLTMSSFGSSPTLTVDPGLSGLEEIESFTSIVNNGNGTATISGLKRDLASQYPYTTTGTGRAHAAGAIVVFSNNPQMYSRFAAYENTGTWTASQVFASTTQPGFDVDPGATYFSNASSSVFIDQAQLSRTALLGCSNASFSVDGCAQLATPAQAASTTITGSTGANLVIPSSMATSTPGISGLLSVISLNDGKLSPAWLNGPGENYTFNATSTFNQGFVDTASTTFTGIAAFTATTTNLTLGILNIATTTATSTLAGNLTIAKNASTTNMTISGTCTGCSKVNIVSATMGNFNGGSPSGASASATCPTGQYVSGGGYNVNYYSGSTVTSSYPSSANVWSVTAESGNGQNGAAGTMYAICVNP